MVQPVKGEHVVTESATVRTLDLATMTVADTEFSSEEVTLRARRDGVRGDEDDDAVKAGAGRAPRVSPNDPSSSKTTARDR